MTALASSMTDVLDALLNEIQQRRKRALAAAPSASRAACLVLTCEQEAWVWSRLFERSRSRIYWRAALSAEAHARACARSWRPLAEAHQSRPESVDRQREGWLS